MSLAKKYRVSIASACAVLLLSGLYMLYMLLVGFLSLGKYDFNGEPNTVAENVLGGAVVLGSIVQFGIAVALVHKGRLTYFLYLVAVALTGLLIYACWLGLGALVWAVPINLNALLMILLYIPQHIAARRIKS